MTQRVDSIPKDDTKVIYPLASTCHRSSWATYTHMSMCNHTYMSKNNCTYTNMHTHIKTKSKPTWAKWLLPVILYLGGWNR